VPEIVDVLAFLLAFGIVALAAGRVGAFCGKIRLPFITGCLLTGILAGPYVLDLIRAEAVGRLAFVNQIALAIIAFAAGSELHFDEIRPRMRSILRVTAGLVTVTFTVGGVAFWLLAGYMPFDEDTTALGYLAMASVVGSILVARSPSSAIAIVREMRAKGPFTQTVLGVTVIMDVVVIVLFSACSELAGPVFADVALDVRFVFLLIVEIAASFFAGVILGKLVTFVLSWRASQAVKTIAILALGWGTFEFSEWFRHFTHERGPFEILVEPLLICMIAGLVVTNRGPYRAEFARIIHDVGPAVYTAFFVLTGASLGLDVLWSTWPIALALFLVRLVSIVIGSFVGGTLAGDPPLHNRVSWMAFITQAGVGIGLAREAAAEFPTWGESVATVVIATIVINQLVGPPLFKWAITIVRESRLKGEHREFDGVRDALIFCDGGAQSLALARQLVAHDWQAKVVVQQPGSSEGMAASDVDVVETRDLSLETMKSLGAADADAVVALLSDEENLEICELVYQEFGMETMVVRLDDRSYLDRFNELGVRVVDPSTALISLLEHFVRSPAATSVLLGIDPEQDIIEIEVGDPDLDGVALRDLNLPLDTLVLSVSRDGHALISHGYTRLRVGDRVTVLGYTKDLEQVTLLFDA